MELQVEKTELSYFEFDFVTKIIKYQGDLEAVTGYNKDELSKMGRMDFKKMVHPMERLIVYEFIEESIQNKKACCMEFRFRKKQGYYIWAELQLLEVCEINGNGKLVGVMKSIMPKRAKVEERSLKFKKLNMLYEWHKEASTHIGDANKILECTLKYINQFYSIDMSFCHIIEKGIFHIVAGDGASDELISIMKNIKFNFSISQLAKKIGEPVSLATENYPEDEVKKILIGLGVAEVTCFPIARENENFGFLFIGTPEVNIFKSDHSKTIENMCSQVAMLLKKDQLYQRVIQELEMRIKVENELKARVEEIRKSRMDLKRILNNTESVMWRVDKNGHYVICEGRAMESAGFKNEALIGRDILEVFSDSSDGGYGIKKALAGVTEEYEVTIGDCTLAISVAPFYDDSGNLDGMVGVGVDITSYQQSEDQNIFFGQIIKLETIRTEFFSNISHELRTPINIILSSIQLMEKTLLPKYPDERLEKYLGTAKISGYRLLRLINNILDITKIDTGFFERNFCNANIIGVLESVVSSAANYIEGKGMSFVFDTDEEERILTCDVEKIERMLLNLLSNAIKYTDAGGLIAVNVYNREHAVIISVKDNGIGIRKSQLTQIFERFSQGDSSLSRRCEGSGIGLSLVKSIVEMHGGRISIRSQIGEGTEVVVELPVTVDNDCAFYSVEQMEPDIIEKKINIEFADIYH